VAFKNEILDNKRKRFLAQLNLFIKNEIKSCTNFGRKTGGINICAKAEFVHSRHFLQ